MSKKIFLGILSILFLMLLCSVPVKAVTSTITVGDFSITCDIPLFNETNLAPGNIITKSITFKNNGTSSQKAGFDADEIGLDNSASPLKSIIFIEIKEGATSLYGAGNTKTLANFMDEGEIQLTNITAGSTAIYTLIATVDENAGDEYQGKTTTFDLFMGSIIEGVVAGATAIRTAPQVLGASIASLPNTGKSIVISLFALTLVGIGLLLRKFH